MNKYTYNNPFTNIDDKKIEVFNSLPTPSYIVDIKRLKENGEILKKLQEETGCKILLAQKCFSCFDTYPILSQYLAGTESSGLYEARLGYERMPGKEVHTFCAAYREDEIEEVIKYSGHIVFNSINQLKKYGQLAKDKNKSVGLRVNPEISTQVGHEMYDPCTPGSRLGVPIAEFSKHYDEVKDLLDGIHFHTLCQQNSDDLKKTVLEFERKFANYIPNLKWLNFGGGHHITRFDYDIETLKETILYMKNKYNVQIYLEPGEGVVLNCGYLITRVLDTFKYANKNIGILDTSAACHNPDVLECGFLPPMYDTNKEGYDITYRFGGPTCLSGDIIGEYNFNHHLKEKELLIFGDTALYTMVKSNTFNGMMLPNIYLLNEDNTTEKLTNFGYNDFMYRLGKTN